MLSFFVFEVGSAASGSFRDPPPSMLTPRLNDCLLGAGWRRVVTESNFSVTATWHHSIETVILCQLRGMLERRHERRGKCDLNPAMNSCSGGCSAIRNRRQPKPKSNESFYHAVCLFFLRFTSTTIRSLQRPAAANQQQATHTSSDSGAAVSILAKQDTIDA